MSTERWQAIDRVWSAVLARPAHERDAALAELCAGDDELRHDVESLLGHLARASAAGFGAPADAARSSLVGRQLGPYAVHALLGAGGMGEVYQARDTTLARDVAIKILPGTSVVSAERRARFNREAMLLASLNHPNIGAIYGVHESDGIRALVLELVDGETLAERIARARADRPGGGLPIAEVQTIAAQVTDAIEAAHERGIIHRDLKPANIKITSDGRAKVLDFGLGRAINAADSRADETQTALDATADGMLLGTAAYMSPEQARGRAVDARTDLWAFGCVLYEMLTGRQAFRGDALPDVLASVVGGEPDWTALPPETPPGLRLCLRRCLQKEPRQRFHHAADVRLALEGAFDDAGRKTHFKWTAAALVAVAGVAIALVLGNRDRSPSAGSTSAAAHPPVLFSPSAGGGGGGATAPTIQQAIDRVASGGTVTLLPGTYAEALTITKGLTIEATGEQTAAATLAPAGTPESVIEIATTEPVTIRGLTLLVPGANGIRGAGAINLTVARTTITAVNPPSGWSRLVSVLNNSEETGARARVVIRGSSLDGAVPKTERFKGRPRNIAISLAGDIDSVIERNIVRRTGDVCLLVKIRDDLGGETNSEILNNDIDECHPIARVGAILVGTPSVLELPPGRPITAKGTVNILGNSLRNSSGDCLSAAIMFDALGGRIERNRIINFVQPCANQTTRNMPAAIWLGLMGPKIPEVPAVVPTVRFNDIHGNARAGFRVASNQKIPVDVSCNYWGSERGPSGVGPGDGDAVLVEPGAAAPRFLPFAKTPITQRTTPGC